MKYSIVVPTYNIGRGVLKCLDSLQCQTYKNIEIVVIDDGSKDDTYEVVKEYAKKYDNMKVYHQENKGVAVARNYGVKKSSGTYCLFVDADDWLDERTIEKVNEVVEANGEVDVVKFGFANDFTNKKSTTSIVSDGELLDAEELRKLHRELLLTENFNNLCSQAFKRELYGRIDNEGFGRIDYGEDAMANLDILGRAKRVVLISDGLYYYYDNPQSATRQMVASKVSKYIADNIELGKKRIKYIEVLDVLNVKSDDVKKSILIPICHKIERYIARSEKADFGVLQRGILQSGFYDFFGDLELNGISGIDRLVIRIVLNKKCRLFSLIRPFARLRVKIRRINKK